MKIIRTTSSNKDFKELVQELDFFLNDYNGESNTFYSRLNKMPNLSNVVIAYIEGDAVGCGAIKTIDESTMEVKRMYTKSQFRNQKIGTSILNELQNWAKELGFQKLILETGVGLVEAQNLYLKSGFKIIENYEPYVNVKTSICFEKRI